MLRCTTWFALAALAAAAGCRSPHAQDRLAGAGAGLGAATGAIIGSQQGNAAEGAIIGAALGTVAGAVTGNAIDNAEARNRAELNTALARPVPRGGLTIDEVIHLVRSGVPETIVVSHIEKNGLRQSVGTVELIHMQQSGVPPLVMAATQRTAVGVVPASAQQEVPIVIDRRPSPTTVVIEREPYPHHHWSWHSRPRRRACVSGGVQFHH